MSSDSIESAAKGATKGFLEHMEERTEECIKNLVERFRNKEIIFIQDRDTIETAKEQLKSEEFIFFKKYVKDSELRVLFHMGLTLRKLEKSRKDAQPLRDKIIEKFDVNGIHIAQTVQNGIFSKYMGNVLERVSSEKRISHEILDLFENIDKRVIFIKFEDNLDNKIREIVTKINSNSPKIFIISAFGSAIKKCEEIYESVMSQISGYSSEIYQTKIRKIFFLSKDAEQ